VLRGEREREDVWQLAVNDPCSSIKTLAPPTCFSRMPLDNS